MYGSTPTGIGQAPPKSGNGLSPGAIAAIIGGSAAAVVVVIVLVVVLAFNGGANNDFGGPVGQDFQPPIQNAPGPNAPAMPGMQPPQIEHENYAEARKNFRTRLTRSTKSPQLGDPLIPPFGARQVTYRSGNLSLRAFVDPDPGDARKRPAVLFLHGGFAYGDGDWEMPQAYRDAGYIVMMPVLRAENNQPGVFTLFYDEVEDVLGAADALATLEYVDENRIFVAGHSAGGTLACLAAMISDRFKAAASFSGVMDQTINVQDDPDLCPFNVRDNREIAMRSPSAFPTSFKCAARLYYGSQEFWARDMTQRTAATAKKAGLDVAAEVVAGDHFTSVEPAMARSIQFFAKFHPPGSEPAPLERDDPIVGRPFQPPTFEPPTVPPPTIPGPTFTPPTGPRGNSAVVVFQVTNYTGRLSATAAARTALFRERWIDPVRISVDLDAGEIVVGVRGTTVDTAAAKAALEEKGFEIGNTEFHPNGR